MLSLMFGGSAALGVNRYVTTGSGAASPKGDAIPVVVAVENISRGASITAKLVALRDYPKGMLPPGALTRLDDALERAVFVPLIKGEPVLDGKLAPKGARRGMAALVPDGMRAFTIHTPSVASGVGGFILPGNKVDVLLTMEGKRGGITTTLVQNLEILAVDQRIDAPADNRVDPNQLRSVTLLVTPDQAARLALAQNKGSLHLSLRNHKDDSLAQTAPARLAELDDGYRERTPVAPAADPRPLEPPGRIVTIYRGTHTVETLRLGALTARPGESAARADDPRTGEFR
jgi:pilus assembly protein CpaB